MASPYKELTNNITTRFQEVADANELPVRYDNDPRENPTGSLWCEFIIDFGHPERYELGIKSLRIVGNFVIEIKNLVGLGEADLVGTGDIIAKAFRNVNLGAITFGVPKIVNVGRVGDNYQVNVICPFSVDKR